MMIRTALWCDLFEKIFRGVVVLRSAQGVPVLDLDEVKERVTRRLAPTYEAAFATYRHYRPWRPGLLANIERTYPMVS